MEKRKNKSSIIRIIISNFNSVEMKEFKVLYTKQGGVDTFLTTTKFDDNGRLIFTSVKEKARNKKFYDIEVVILENGNKIEIKKYDKIRNQLIRYYEVEGTYKNTNNHGKKIILKVTDLYYDNIPNPRGIRSKTSETERLLLSKDLVRKYSKIALCSEDEIDSKKLYKIKKFFNYRSNMLIYFNFINDFLTKGTEKKELWEIDTNSNENMDIILENIKNYLSIGIENYNNYVKNINKKISRENEEALQLRELSEDELREDILKIIKIFSSFRHKLMHYNYEFFEKLFDNEKVDLFQEDLRELLNLNLFKIIDLLKVERVRNKTNYITKDSKIILLGKIRSAKTTYEFYNDLCSRKNGFNNFINGFFVKDGIEDSDFKEVIRNSFNEDYKRLEKKKLKDENKSGKKKNNPGDYNKFLEKIYNFQNEYKDIFYWDINDSPKYKELYNERKELIEKYNKQINGIRDKKYITELNKKLLSKKEKMEKITKDNSLIRLRYKLQIAYGFLMEEFKGDIEKFKTKFDTSRLEEIQGYYKKRNDYLNYQVDDKVKLNMNSLKNLFDETYINQPDKINEKNYSMKFYILNYILLPTEIRGDFLGFIKKYYYDIKNVDFVDENLKEKELEKCLEKETFFHDIRLFEKNIKHYQLINYELEDFYNLRDKLGEYLESLKITNWRSQNYRNSSDRNIFGKNIILPIFKFYENIFKLLNDIELHSIFHLMEKNSWNTVEEAILTVNKGAENPLRINFSKLLNSIASSNRKPKVAIDFQIRNDIAHMSYYNTLENILFETDIDFYSHLSEKAIKELSDKKIKQVEKKKVETINERVDTIINGSEVRKILNMNLGFNFINDYYMRKEKFIFNQRGLEKEDILNPQQKEQKEMEKEILSFYKVNRDNQISLNKLYSYGKDLLEGNYKSNKELWNILQNKKIIMNKGETNTLSYYHKNPSEEQLDKIKKFIYREGSHLLGVYKKIMIRKIKESLIKKFTKNENKYLRVILTDTSSLEKNKNKEYTVILKREDISEKFIILDEKNLNNKEGLKRKDITKEIEIITDDNEKFYLNNKENFEEKRLIVDFSKKFNEENNNKIFVPGKYIYKIKEKI